MTSRADAADLADLVETQIAVEHVLWAASQRMTARDLMTAIRVDWPSHKNPSWHDAVQALIWRRHRLGAAPKITPLRRVA